MQLIMESLLLTLFLLARLFAPGAAASTNNSTDYLALLSFKSLVTASDPALVALASWGNLSVPVCRWRGVACGMRGRRRGRVVALDLPGLGIHGTVPPQLGNLTYLRRLHLQENHLQGVLPPELGNLGDLTNLNLSFNSFQGSIPKPLSNCTRLERLVLYSNSLHGEIPQELYQLRSLQGLFLGMNNLTGRIPLGIANLVELRFLTLELNNLIGEIPQEMGGLVKLEVLGLGGNLLTGPVPPSLGNLSALKILSIPQTHLTGSIPSMQNLSSLQVLELSDNNLTGSIPVSVGNLSSLTYLDVRGNSLTGCIPKSLGSLHSLYNLQLQLNSLSCSIPQSFGNLNALQILSAESNHFEGPFPTSLFNLSSSLTSLSLSANRLSGPLPPDIGDRLPNMHMLLVSDNEFHGTIPTSLCNISVLQYLEAEFDFLSGKIPQCLGTRQKKLSYLSLTGNQLETKNYADWGFLSSLTNCSNLKTLDLSDNSLQGELPSTVGNLSLHLKYLRMTENKIAGEIPVELENLISLEWLSLDNNLLKGTIPASLGKLKMLNQLSLAYNNLSGSIPPTLGNLTTLNILQLQGNALDGGIPSSLSSCPLEKLDLSYNSLTGKMPKELFLISALSAYMLMGNNFLSGSLPSEIGNLVNLGILDLSSNNISGEIPISIGLCQSLENVNMSGNILQGTIPPSLAQLSGLLVLDLSHNNLSGAIPAFLGSLRGLSTLNISFNKFEGEVPEVGIFLNATATLVTGNDALCGGVPQLKLPPCSNYTTKKPKHVIIFAVCSAVAFITLVFALSTFYHRRRKIKENMQISLSNDQYMRVSYAELANATNGFITENLIGAGSFGSVYKGTIRNNGQELVVAVKVLNLMQRGASQSFVAECETLRCVRHRNLMKVLTVCASIDFQGRDFKALVYEFLPNGNLDHWLHQHIMEDGKHQTIDLRVRLQIAIDVASSLEYLHKHKPTPIIHCDLKPSNILLDGEMVAHVGDFGLARFLHQDSDQSSGWASMRGTVGYAAPEYGLGNEVSINGDVYSYGILLLEMFTGKRPTDSEFGEALGLRKYVQSALPDRAVDVIDTNLLLETENTESSTSNHNMTSRDRDITVACITSILHTGISCSAETPTDRVQIGDTLKELQTIRDNFLKDVRRQGELEN